MYATRYCKSILLSISCIAIDTFHTYKLLINKLVDSIGIQSQLTSGSYNKCSFAFVMQLLASN